MNEDLNIKLHDLWISYKRSQAEQTLILNGLSTEPTQEQVIRLLAYAKASEQALQKLVEETGK
jgi:hypothetical protein